MLSPPCQQFQKNSTVLLQHCAGIAGFGLLQCTCSSCVPIPCQHQFASHGIADSRTTAHGECDEKYHWWCRIYYQQDLFNYYISIGYKIPSLPLDCKWAIFISYLQWLNLLLIGNTMKNAMLRKSFKMLEVCRLNTAHPRAFPWSWSSGETLAKNKLFTVNVPATSLQEQ